MFPLLILINLYVLLTLINICFDVRKPIHPVNSTKIIGTVNSNKPVHPVNSSKPAFLVNSIKFMRAVDVRTVNSNKPLRSVNFNKHVRQCS